VNENPMDVLDITFAYLWIGIFTGVRVIASQTQLALFRGIRPFVMLDY